MRAFRKALASLPNSKPVFNIKKGWYHNDITLECIDQISYHEADLEGFNPALDQDLELAKAHWVESWNCGDRVFKTAFEGSEDNLRNQMVRHFHKFLMAHSTQKNPKTTKTYKFIDSCGYLMNRNDDAKEALYSLYKYMYFHNTINLESTNIHVQNTLKIIEVLRHRFEKELE